MYGQRMCFIVFLIVAARLCCIIRLARLEKDVKYILQINYKFDI